MTNKTANGNKVKVASGIAAPADPELIREELEDLDTDEKLQEFQQQFGGKGYKIRVQKWTEDQSQWLWVDRFPLDGFDVFWLRPKYGHGRYRLQLLDGKGRYVEGGSEEIHLAQAIEPAAAAAEPKALSPMQDPVVQMMFESLKQQAANSLELTKSMIAAQSSAPGKSQLGEVLQGLAQLQQLTPKDAGMKGIKELLEMMTLFKSFTGADREPAAGGGSWVSEIREAVETAALLKEKGLLPGQAGAAAPPAPNLRTAPAATVVAAAPRSATPVPPEATPVSDTLNTIKFYLPQLIRGAQRNEPAEIWANFVYDRLEQEIVPLVVKEYGGLVTEDGVWELLLEKAKNPEELNKIFNYAPDLLAHADWTRAVVAELVKQIEQPAP